MIRTATLRASLLLTLWAALPAAAEQELLIVSIGDSYASGEGNPNALNFGVSEWTDTPCHRSRKNGRWMAAERIAKLGVKVEFYDFSCSGATINSGLIGEMESQAPETPGEILGGQLEQVVALQEKLNGRAIDILMISIGGNDVWFPAVVRECLKFQDCRTADTVTEAIQRITDELPGRFDTLGEKIRETIKVEKVYITHYPNGLQLEMNRYCGDFDDLFTPTGDLAGLLMRNVSIEENRFLIPNFLRPLNDEITAAATRNGWQVVTGVEDTFVPHGYCNPHGKRWLHTLGDSFLHQSTHTGTAHPTVDGHRAYADSLIRQATMDFVLPLEQPRLLRIAESNVGNTFPIATPGTGKRVQVEIGQTAANLEVWLQYRIRGPFQTNAPAYVSIAMTDIGEGELNLFHLVIPGSQNLGLLEQLEYRIQMKYSWAGSTYSFTTSPRTIVVNGVLRL